MTHLRQDLKQAKINHPFSGVSSDKQLLLLEIIAWWSDTDLSRVQSKVTHSLLYKSKVVVIKEVIDHRVREAVDLLCCVAPCLTRGQPSDSRN